MQALLDQPRGVHANTLDTHLRDAAAALEAHGLIEPRGRRIVPTAVALFAAYNGGDGASRATRPLTSTVASTDTL